MSPDFWNDKRVFITGHTGFKGSWLCLLLSNMGARCFGYALKPQTQPSLFLEAGVEDRVERHTTGDIRDLAKLAECINQAEPEIVFHFAAQPLVRKSYELPVETYSVNVVGTATLLEAVRQASSVKAVVVVTTDKCYENREWTWGYRETDTLGGFDPYSSSKACAELVAAAYRRSFFQVPGNGELQPLGIATARAGNVIGGGDWSDDRLLPDLFRAVQRGEQLVLRHPQACRPWQHVLEPLCGYLCLAQALAEQGGHFGQAFNFGPSETDCLSVGEVVAKAGELLGQPPNWRQQPGRQLHESSLLRLDSSKAHKLLGWFPVLSVEEALQWTVQWQQSWQMGTHARELTLEQIRAFQKRLAFSPSQAPADRVRQP